MKVCIVKEEWYPIFVIDDEFRTLNVDIPEEIFYKYKSVLEDWKSIQSKLAEFYYKDQRKY
jgi:hypothetical protein